ncbi:juvenile hormone esterase-like [Bicyclus anynana]|uniref:Juvenile hormone esterase-like n=1 Tax=Bicyclus anynana TaxID=110368 RepID=A0ABM3LGJ7_BICAN|nr:juvenile hormone esterase-like [Bicyclus anynana]
MKLTLIYVLCLVISVYCIDSKVDPLVIIGQGLVRGTKSSDGSYSSFLGIPYALVNTSNPFGPAIPHTGFGINVFNAYYGQVKCPQLTIHDPNVLSLGTEVLDCLRLNIYSPIAASSQNPLPVLVWIHGGNFGVGFGGEFGPEKFVKQNIVVVTVNYRLGPYGFMCLDIPAVPGNQGLKDQFEALQWIRKNIGSFGGNPYNVTIAGQGAGACSALLHLYSDKQKIYHKVIAQSGTPQNVGVFVEADVDAATKLAAHLGFNTTSNEEALTFLTGASHELVTAAAVELNLNLKPCREKSFSGIDNFVENYPLSLSNEKKVRNTPILIGHTSNENLKLLSTYDDDYFKGDPFDNKIRSNFNLDDDQLDDAVKIVKRFYIGDESVSKLLEPQLEKFESDVVHNHPVQRTITKLLSENANPIYEYEFRFSDNDELVGAAHYDELPFMFQMLNAGVETDNNKLIISDRMTTMWANFIKFGNPTPQTNDLLPITWSPVSADVRPYIVIDSDIQLKRRINHERMAFWDLFYSSFGKHNKFMRKCNLVNSPIFSCSSK